MRIALGLALLLGACVQTATSDCGGGVVCREGTVCHQITYDNNGDSQTSMECVSEDQLTECADLADKEACDNGNGTCYSHACLPAACGNGRIDGIETCDDGNVALGDGCSSTCQAEVCGNGVVDPLDTTRGTPLPREQCDDGNTLGHDGCASTCVPEVPRWRRIPGSPLGRNFAGMAVEVSARRAIMFGGFSPFSFASGGGPMGGAATLLTDGYPLQGTPNGETWELSAEGWSRLDTLFAPSPRGAHAMANDGTRTLLVGGAQYLGAVFDDVWELRDGGWTQLANLPPGMGARAGAAMAYWPGHGMVLVGGVGKESKPVGDTWLLADGTSTWTPYVGPVGTSEPEARSFATLTYDAAKQRLVLAGGTGTWVDGSPVPSYALDDAGWTRLVPASVADPQEPYAYGSAASYDPARGVVVAGGYDNLKGRVADVWVWDGTAWSRSDQTVEQARFGAAGSTDPITGRLQVFGGQAVDSSTCSILACLLGGGTPFAAVVNGRPNDDVFTFDGTGWNPRHFAQEPPFLARAGYTYDADRARVVVFGGDTYDGTTVEPLSATTYEIVEHTWLAPQITGTPPPAVVSPSLAYAAFDSVGGARATFMFGGSTSSGIVQATNQFYRLDQAGDGSAQWNQVLSATKPPPRAGAMMLFDPARKHILLFGGAGDSPGRLADTWDYDGVTWKPVMTTIAPPARDNAAFAYDPINKVALMWGGVGDDVTPGGPGLVLGDFWKFDGATQTWTQISRTFGPSPRPGARFAWDARRRRMVLWGGTDNTIWEWDGNNWSYVPAFEAPEAHKDPIFIQIADGGILAHGGTDSFGLVDQQTLELVRESATQTSYTSCYSQLDEDRDGRVGCEDQDCWAYCSPSCPPGATGPDCDTTQSCGDHTCDEPRENCGICPLDCGECPVTP